MDKVVRSKVVEETRKIGPKFLFGFNAQPLDSTVCQQVVTRGVVGFELAHLVREDPAAVRHGDDVPARYKRSTADVRKRRQGNRARRRSCRAFGSCLCFARSQKGSSES